jgi:hypothetical protein
MIRVQIYRRASVQRGRRMQDSQSGVAPHRRRRLRRSMDDILARRMDGQMRTGSGCGKWRWDGPRSKASYAADLPEYSPCLGRWCRKLHGREERVAHSIVFPNYLERKVVR